MDFIQELQRFWQKQGFEKLQYPSRILWKREDNQGISLVDIIPERLPGQPGKTPDQLESEMAELERNLMLRGQKKVDRLTLMICSDLPTQTQLQETEGYTNIWWLDWKHGEVLIYERQRTDFLGMRRNLEDMLSSYQEKDRQESRRELGRMLQPVTIGIVMVNVTVFILLDLLGSTEDSAFMAGHGAMSWTAIVQGREYYRLFTAMFLHFGVQHLLQNMLVLMLIGTRMERSLGRIRYLLVYVGSGLIASISSVLFTLYASYDIAAGASGAIFGIMGGLVYLLLKDTIGKNRRYIREIGLTGVLFMVICAASYGFFEAGVDNAAHIGGLIGGFLLTGILTVRGRTGV